MLLSATFSDSPRPRPRWSSISAVEGMQVPATSLSLCQSSLNLTGPSDVIPWQCWTRYPQYCAESRAVFVDVDFPDLIRKKRQVVLNTPELASHLTGVRSGDDGQDGFFLRSDRYYQVGCDLRHTVALERALASIRDLRNCLYLFVAEVSITYMETMAADALIQWASSIGDGKSHCCHGQAGCVGPSAPSAQSANPFLLALLTIFVVFFMNYHPAVHEKCCVSGLCPVITARLGLYENIYINAPHSRVLSPGADSPCWRFPSVRTDHDGSF